MTTLAQQLKERNEKGRANIPADSLVVMDAMTAEVAASGIANSSLGVGAKVSEFTLPNADGTMVSLSSLLARGPVVIAFYRGGWCPLRLPITPCRSRKSLSLRFQFSQTRATGWRNPSGSFSACPWRFADPDYTKRAEPDDVVAAVVGLQALTPT